MIKNIKKTSSLGLLDFPPSRISVFQACDPRMNTMAFRKYIFCMANQVFFSVTRRKYTLGRDDFDFFLKFIKPRSPLFVCYAN